MRTRSFFLLFAVVLLACLFGWQAGGQQAVRYPIIGTPVPITIPAAASGNVSGMDLISGEIIIGDGTTNIEASGTTLASVLASIAAAPSTHYAEFTYSAVCGEMDDEKCWLVSVDGAAATESDSFDSMAMTQDFPMVTIAMPTYATCFFIEVTTPVAGLAVPGIEVNIGGEDTLVQSATADVAGYYLPEACVPKADDVQVTVLDVVSMNTISDITAGVFTVYWTETVLPTP